jgi:hypothetical protein
MASLFSLALAQDNMLRGKYINAQTGTTYTLALVDAGAIVTLTNAGAIALTVPANADVAFATNSVVILIAGGAGVVTVAGDTGVTVNSANSDATLAQNDWGILVKTGTNTWQFTVVGGTGGGGSGAVVQVVSTQTGATATGSVAIPIDDTIPQNTEGTEVITRAITPTDVAHTLRIDVSVFLTAGASKWMIGALFQDTTADALAVGAAFNETNTAGSTVKLRVGCHDATAIRMNGQGAARLWGGVAASSITITEIIP